MQSKVSRVIMSGIGVATLAALSLFAGKDINQTTGADLSAKANDHNANQRLACRPTPGHPCPAVVGGVRG
ncbi:MAG: hypothetical protein WA743_15565 [Pseudolabrys sp.]